MDAARKKSKARKRGNGEGSIFQRKDGRWVGMLATGYENGRRLRKTFYGADRADVVKQITEAMVKQHQGEPIPTGRKTVGEFLDQWLTECVKPHARPKTFSSYEEQIRLHIKPALAHLLLRKLTGQQVQNFVNRLADKKSANTKSDPQKLSARTVAYNLTVLRMALRQAVEWRLIPFNPAGTGIKRARIERKKPTSLDPDHARKLLDAIKGDRLSALFLLMLYTGLRRGEALGLSWSDMDLEGKQLTVRKTLQRVSKELVLGDPKTEQSRRTIPISISVIAAMREHRARQLSDRMRLGPDWQDTGLVFTTELGTAVDPRNVKRVFDRLLRGAKLTHMRLHDLRHACASCLLAEGVDLKTISTILGHSSIRVTADVYAHVNRDQISAAMDRLDQAIQGMR